MLLTRFHKKVGKIHQQFIRYFFVAGISALVDLGTVYFFVHKTSLHYTIAITTGFLLGTFCNFLISNTVVFRRIGNIYAVCARHFLSSLLGLLTNLSVVIFCVEHLEMNVMPAKFIALLIGFFVNFAAIKFFAFRDFSV